MRWIDVKNIEIDGVRFFVEYDPAVYLKFNSTPSYFLLLKAHTQIARYEALAKTREFKNILELGIWQGGSCVFFQKLFRPEKHVALEKSEDPEALRQYIKEQSLSKRLIPALGVDQADTAKVEKLLLEHFPDRDIDLVVDDASHLLGETQASFNAIFPFLREGGIYVIEDWAWAHWDVPLWQDGGGYWKDRPALTNLLFEIVMLAGSHPDIVAELTICDNMALIRRGPTRMDVPFDVSNSYLSRGRRFVPEI